MRPIRSLAWWPLLGHCFAAALLAETPRPGLVVSLTDGRQRIDRVSATPHFHLREGESLHPTLAPSFSAEWSGYLTVVDAGTYGFDAGAASLTIAGREIAGAADRVELRAGRHALRMAYRRAPGPASLQLRWRSEHFLEEPVPGSVLSHDATEATSAQATVDLGRRLVEELGCTNCHASSSDSLKARLAPVLSGLGARVNARWIYRWLENPRHFRQTAVMPGMLDASGRLDVTLYLASLGDPPERPVARPSPHDVNKGAELFQAIGCAACHDPASEPLGGMGSKMTVAALARYLRDPAKVAPGGRMPSLLLSATEARQLAAFLGTSTNEVFECPLPEGGDPERGRDLVARSGCLACHALEAPRPLRNTLQAPPFAALRPAAGCLADEPPGQVPRYRMSPRERHAVSAFLEDQRAAGDISPAPIHDFERRLEQLRCTACHEFEHSTPNPDLPEKAPSLTGVGAKLQSEWLRRVLLEKERVRERLLLRMPHYTPDAVEPLIAGFALASGLVPGKNPGAPPGSPEDRRIGVRMIGSGDGGLSCIVCHDVGEHRPVADEKGPQMTTTTARLRHEWFRRWMYQPGRIVSGTSMPTYFLDKPRREALAEIDRLWAALSLAEAMPEPVGVGGEAAWLGSEARPVPGHRAVVIRNVMPGATPAAIAVGLPRRNKQPGVSYCFDAGECRLVYAWQGGFLDLSPSLVKKMEHPKILGDIFHRTEAFPLRAGAVDRVPERRFRGYRLVDGFPVFRYEIDGVEVREGIVPDPDGRGLVHEFLVTRVDGPMWFVVAESPRVVLQSTVGPFEEGRLAIPRGVDVRFDVRVTRAPQGGGSPEEAR